MEQKYRYDIEGFSVSLGLPLENMAELYSELIKEIDKQMQGRHKKVYTYNKRYFCKL